MDTKPCKALAACRAYREANEALKAIQRRIGYALTKCPRSDDPEIHPEAKPHLIDLFKDTNEEGSRTCLSDVEIREFLVTDYDCPACLTAFELIIERRKLRQEFGKAKRAIAMVGREQ